MTPNEPFPLVTFFAGVTMGVCHVFLLGKGRFDFCHVDHRHGAAEQQEQREEQTE